VTLLQVGRVIKPHGLRGEVIVELSTNRTDRLVPGASFEGLVVEHARPHQGRWIVQFEDVFDRDSAEKLRNRVLRAEPLDDPDVLWVHDLVGSYVVDGMHGWTYGRVRSVEANPASDLLVLEGDRLVPLTFVTKTESGVLTIDPPTGLLDPVELVAPQSDWPVRFEEEAERLRAGLGSTAVRIDHIGSTAVPDLPAKPIVDIQLSVPDVDDRDAWLPGLEALGWEPVVLDDYPFLRRPGYHLHVCTAGGEDERHHLTFRDRLRRDTPVRDEYLALKRDNAGMEPEAYADAKSDFVRQYW
jgi:16S rRNA processing protein RimM